MGSNCCSQTEDKPEVNTQRKISLKSKHGAQNIEQDDLHFKEDCITTQYIQSELYSVKNDDPNEDVYDEETDWENYDKDVTLERKGATINMFKSDIINELLINLPEELKEVYNRHGTPKLKAKDIPTELDPEEIEFKHEAYRNDDGDIYVGEFRKGTTIREGRGLLISKDNYLYEGFWVDDRKNGYGRILLPNGNVYQGQWANDVSEGKGIYLTEDGLIYKGEWKSNKCNGNGFELYKDGSFFKGKFKDGEKSGEGVFKWSDGKEYNGNFKAGCMDGYGEFTWPDGRSYRGDWVNDKKEAISVFMC